MMADAEPALTSVVSGKYAMIDYWGRVKAEDERVARRILDDVEAGYLADRRWQVLSQGERQRVLIGRALMADPQLLILDEPCAGLDPVAREQFLAFIQRLGSRKNAPALILVTHHIEEIMPVFTHILLLRGGAIVGSGPRKEVLNSRSLSEVFGARCTLVTRNGRHGMRIATAPLRH
jgi:iron complex transport system ATP-binding protein